MEWPYGDTAAYTGKLHSLLRMIYLANTEPHLRLLHYLAYYRDRINFLNDQF